MSNPLLDTSALPRFGDIVAEDVLPALEKLIAEHRGKLAALLNEADTQDFDPLVRLSSLRHPVLIVEQ